MGGRMKPSDFTKSVLLRENKDHDSIAERLSNIGDLRLLHAMIGMCTEVGEFQDMMKKHMIYGKSLDRVNLKEELGDILWYVALAVDELGTTFEDIMATNNAKLAARYGDVFTKEAALNRDLNTEREILENGIKSNKEK
jgi:NTP pyrophosphatase (non-canonical NTP hydrolase)